MLTFLIGLAVLFVGGAVYGHFCEKVFDPDDRKTPASSKQDNVDYIPMKGWKNGLLNLLNIAGTGPILGPIQGILFGPVAFLTIPIGSILGGAMHDYFTGMICTRHGGTQMPGMIRRYTGPLTSAAYRICVCMLLLLVGAVFVYTPGDVAAVHLFGLSGQPDDYRIWIIYGAIFAYYLIATVFPINTIIGRIYPVFGVILLVSALGVFIALFIKGYPLLNVWDDWNSGFAFRYGDYFTENHFIPTFFVTVACGILSGFHSTQTALISRTLTSEKHGIHVFYSMMILEGFIAMIWAAAAMGVYSLGVQEADPSLATDTVGVICKDLLGNAGGIIALIGVIILPITTGDTALRALRLTIAEAFNINQSSSIKRLCLSAAILTPAVLILVWAKVNSQGFAILWRYFGWSNQALALFAFAAISNWMFENGKAKFIWMPLVPGTFYAFVTASYILNARIGLNISLNTSYIIASAFAVFYIVITIISGKTRRDVKLNNSAG